MDRDGPAIDPCAARWALWKKRTYCRGRYCVPFCVHHGWHNVMSSVVANRPTCVSKISCRGKVPRRFGVIPEPYGVHGRFKGSILSGALCSLPVSDRRLPLWLLLGGSLPSEVGDELFNLRGVESITHGIEYLFPCHRGEIPLSSFPAIRHLEERGAP